MSLDIVYFFVSRVWILCAMHTSPFTDLGRYFEVSQSLWAGQVPYQDFVFEYPPLALVLIWLPGWIARFNPVDSQAYFFPAFRIQMFLIDCLLFWLIRRLARQHQPTKLASYYVVFTSCLSGFLLERMDLAVALCLFWALDTSKRQLWAKSASAIACGALLKLVPWIILPAALGKPANYRKLTYSFLIAVGIPLIIFGLLTLAVGKKAFTFLTYHSDRGIQTESTWGSAILTGRMVGVEDLADVETINNYGAIHLTGNIPGRLVKIIPGVFLVFFATVLFLLFRNRHFECEWRTFLVGHSLLLGFILVNKFFSPQFLIWLLPITLFACLGFSYRRAAFMRVLLFLVVVLTAFLFHQYEKLIALENLSVMLLTLRNLLLVILWWVSFPNPKKMQQVSYPN